MRVIRLLAASSVGGGIFALVTSATVASHLSELMSAGDSDARQSIFAAQPVALASAAEPPRPEPLARAPVAETAGVATNDETPRRGVGARPTSSKSGSPRPARAGRRSSDDLAQSLIRGIKKLGEHRYEIRRSSLDLALANGLALSRWIRVAPELRDERAVGFRLFAVAADGPFAKLGLRDDDVLVAINGLDIATPDRALEAYGKLKTADRLALRLLRGGSEVVLDYVIR